MGGLGVGPVRGWSLRLSASNVFEVLLQSFSRSFLLFLLFAFGTCLGAFWDRFWSRSHIKMRLCRWFCLLCVLALFKAFSVLEGAMFTLVFFSHRFLNDF